ncbi:S8 family peptidase [Stutzerimonas zhaodongensis]|uniref:S8 family peptidase n=1 Tax=Stutzerimonas zhaodongensis TaxID=1176257 RepID=UPI0039F13B4A
MKKNLLASAICLAIATSPVSQAAFAAGQATAPAAATTASVSPEVAAMASDISAAAARSPEDLKQLLASVSDDKADTLQAASEYLTEQQLIDARSAELVQERIVELSGTKASAGSLFKNTYAQVGLAVAGVAGIAAASGGGGGGSSHSQPQTSQPVVTPPVAEPTPPVAVEPPVAEPTPPVVVQPPVTDPTPPVVVQPPASRPTQNEYDFGGGMSITGIQAAHAKGYTGRNALIAVLDTGFYSEHIELGGQFAGFYNAYTRSESAADAVDNNGHGTHVAGIIAAKANGIGSVGYAPDTKLLGVRIGDGQGKLTNTVEETAAAFRWAREHRADFINNSWGRPIYVSQVSRGDVEAAWSPLIAEFRTGAQGDVVYVWATGNEGTDQPGIYAALPQLFPELKANWVAVANIDDSTGRLEATSQHCGNAKEWCISAPGTYIWAPVPDSRGNDYYAPLTGTSMAAPAVTGALAVLKDAFPMLTNEKIVERLFVTANKQGIYSDSDLYGQGLMDVDKASMPLGTMSLVSGSGQIAPLSMTTMRMGGAFGDSNPFQGVQVMALDSQGAGFMTDLGGVVQTQTYRHDLVAATDRLSKQAPRQVSAGHGMTLTFSHNGVDADVMDNMVMGFTDNSGLTTRFGLVSSVDVLAGGVNFAGSSQQKVSFAAPYWMSETDSSAFGLQQGFGLAGGNLAFTAVSTAERTGVSSSYSYNLVDAYIPTLEIGLVNGKDSLFGTETGGALGFSNKAETRFIGVRGEFHRNDVTLFHSAYMGQSDVSARGLISGVDTVVTSSWSFGGKYDRGIQQYGLLVAQPLKVESANTSLSFIDGYQNGAFTTSTVNVNLAPTGRQINTELYFATASRAFDDIKVSLMRMDQPGHNAYAKADHVATFSLGTRF